MPEFKGSDKVVEGRIITKEDDLMIFAYGKNEANPFPSS
jgi:hypothetical protein